MTLVYDVQQIGQPGTHVLVLGVNDYPHFPGGSLYDENPSELELGLGQLTSPGHSAAEVAKWFEKEYNNPNAPLASIEFLSSRGHYLDIQGNTIEVDKPNLDRIEAAARSWYARCNHDESFAVFYYCGHGINANYNETILLASDFGQDPLSVWGKSISFNRFYNNMASCKASQQWYFVDACRQNTHVAQKVPPDESACLIQTGAHRFKKRNAPIFYASAPGSQAYGDRDQPSYFSAGLIEGLRGKGSKRVSDPGPWIVTATSLEDGLHQYLSQLATDGGTEVSIDFSKAGDSPITLGGGFIHQLPLESIPMVTLTVTCAPESALSEASLTVRCLQSESTQSREPRPSPWALEVAAGNYEVKAQISTLTKVKSVSLSPPAWGVEVSCHE